jgi:hypothetical protein
MELASQTQGRKWDDDCGKCGSLLKQLPKSLAKDVLRAK